MRYSALLTRGGQLLNPTPLLGSPTAVQTPATSGSQAVMSGTPNTQYSLVTQGDQATQMSSISLPTQPDPLPPANQPLDSGNASAPNTQYSVITTQDDTATQMSAITQQDQAGAACKKRRLWGKQQRPNVLQPPPTPPSASCMDTNIWESKNIVRTKVRDEWIRYTMESKGLQGIVSYGFIHIHACMSL